MIFHFTTPESGRQLPPGFCASPDGGIAIDDPSLTKVISSEPFNSSDPESIESLKNTSRWVDHMGWVPLQRFKEWAENVSSKV